MVWLQVKRASGVLVHPVRMELSRGGWVLICAMTQTRYPEAEWGDITLSARRFAATGT
jgi:hypothetical protein